jgi:MarR family transcriptional regulator for hemolysin
MAATAKPTEQPMPQDAPADLGWLLWQASHVLKTQLTAALEEVGISPRDHHVLKKAMTGDLTQIDIAHAIGLDKTTMVVTLDELEKAGLARRRPSAKDRRARIVEVTPKGRRKVAQGEEIVERVQAEALGALSPDEREAFLAALCRLASASPAECAQPVRRRM